MRSPNDEDRIDWIARRMDEMERRTMSTLTVTNPVDGIAYLDIQGGHVRIRDGAGSSIMDTVAAPGFGYVSPLQNYVMFFNLPPLVAAGFSGPLVTTASATFSPNQARLNITTVVYVESDTGAVADYQISYTVNGGSPVVIPGSVSSTSTPWTPITLSYSYAWPGDYFTSTIKLLFQARIRPGTGDPALDDVIFSPLRLYGVPL